MLDAVAAHTGVEGGRLGEAGDGGVSACCLEALQHEGAEEEGRDGVGGVLGEDGDVRVCVRFVGAGFSGSGGPEEGEEGRGGKTWLLWRVVGNAIGGGEGSSGVSSK